MKRLRDALRELIPLLPDGARPFITFYIIATSALALLDVAALALLASILNPMILGTTASLPLIGTISTASYPWILGLVCALLITKAAAALLIQWVATRRFRNFELTVGDHLFTAYLHAPWSAQASRSTAQIVRMADIGIANTISAVLLPAISLPQHFATFSVIVIVLLVAQPLVAVLTLAYLGIAAFSLYAIMSKAAVMAGQVNLRYSMRVSQLMTEMVSTLKELTLRGRLDEVTAQVRREREHSTRARANLHFLSAVPQRFVEAALVGGFVLVGTVALLVDGPASALTSIALFAVAGFRLVPALVNFQQVMTQTANGIPHLEAVLADIHASQQYIELSEAPDSAPLPTHPKNLEVSHLTVKYPDASHPAIQDVSVAIPFGSAIGIVGASGSGKSTLIDTLLGLIPATSGTVSIDGIPLNEVRHAWRRRVGYVPQEVCLFDGTIAQNIALTWGDDIDHERVNTVIDLVQLRNVVDARPEATETRIGERGLSLSGGERQRLGIARALYASPLILIMDEATSALDTTTENAITSAIAGLHGEVTVISVAHRLSTIRHCDQLIFMDAGTATVATSFDELVQTVPEFARQAAFAGLADHREDDGDER